jgi:RNA polymerase sigma-70 factor (ECF subfamily)
LPTATLAPRILNDLFRKADAQRWALLREEFRDVIEASVEKAFPTADRPPRELDRYLAALHLEDLALAAACALGRDAAWEHFVLNHRPVLYRAADALSPGGGARELADSLYADLYGLPNAAGQRQSLFRYFHGRSSLATWLRSVLAQRFVDVLRAQRRMEPLPDIESAMPASPPASNDPDRTALVPLVEKSLRAAIELLPPKDRLRLRSYYVSQLTLAEIGRITGEHEATVSRHLARTRRTVREEMERSLRSDARLSEAQAIRAVELALEDAGGLNVQQILEERKNSPVNRSESEG